MTASEDDTDTRAPDLGIWVGTASAVGVVHVPAALGAKHVKHQALPRVVGSLKPPPIQSPR